MKRFTETNKWEDPWFRRLKPKFKTLLVYLFDRCDSAGVWVVDMELAATYIGEKISREDAVKAFDGRVVEIGNGKWLLPQFVSFQYGILSPACHPHRRILEALDRHGLHVVNGKTTLTTTLADTLPMGSIATLEEEDKEKEEDKEGIKPEWSVGVMDGAKMVYLELPERLRSPECMAALEKWLAYKAERKFKYKKLGLQAALSEWAAEFDALSFPNAVQFSMSNNYQGVFARNASISPVNGSTARPPTISDLRTVIQAKETSMAAIKRRYCSEVATGDLWNDDAKRREYNNLKREVRELNEKLAKAL